LWETYAHEVEFVVVYIREAHPEDGWVISMNREQDIEFNDPTSNEERQTAATNCAIRLKIKMPVVVDDIDDRIASHYGALPDRLYLIDKGGKVAYQGEPGPWGFDPNKLEKAIKMLDEVTDRQ
jgi:hypothetical protein